MAWWNELPIAGGLLGSIFGNPEQEAQEKAMQDAAKELRTYRPEVLNARLKAMGMMSHAFEPMNNLMGQMYGSQAQTNIPSMIGNPFSEEYQKHMQDQANPPPKPGGATANAPLKQTGYATPGTQWTPGSDSNYRRG